jgi:hypothetical protein
MSPRPLRGTLRTLAAALALAVAFLAIQLWRAGPRLNPWLTDFDLPSYAATISGPRPESSIDYGSSRVVAQLERAVSVYVSALRGLIELVGGDVEVAFAVWTGLVLLVYLPSAERVLREFGVAPAAALAVAVLSCAESGFVVIGTRWGSSLRRFRLSRRPRSRPPSAPSCSRRIGDRRRCRLWAVPSPTPCSSVHRCCSSTRRPGSRSRSSGAPFSPARRSPRRDFARTSSPSPP